VRVPTPYWQKEGVGIGNVASGAMANGTLLVGERDAERNEGARI